MKKIIFAIFAFFLALSCTQTPVAQEGIATLASPDGNIKLELSLDGDGTVRYSVNYGDTPVILPSLLGFEMRGTVKAENFDYGTSDVTKKDAAPSYSMSDGFEVLSCTPSTFDETWSPVWGEESEIRNHYNELLVEMKQKESGRLMNIRFRAFDDGIGFR